MFSQSRIEFVIFYNMFTIVVKIKFKSCIIYFYNIELIIKIFFE